MSEEIKAKFCFKPLVVTGIMTIVLGLLFWLADYMFCWGAQRAFIGLLAGAFGVSSFGNSLMYSLQWFFGGLIYIVVTIVFLAATFFGATYRPSVACANKFLSVIPQIFVFICAILVAVLGVLTGVDIFSIAMHFWWEGFWVTFNGVFQYLISVIMILLNVLAVVLAGFFLVKRIAK